MYVLYFVLIVLGVIILILIIFGVPRKKSIRHPNIEGLDAPEVAEAFEKVANFLPFKLLRKKVISQVSKLSPTGKLIDVGCGSGNLIVQIAQKFKHLELIGMDISSEILELAKRRAIKKGFADNIEFKEGSVEKIPFPDNCADYIVSTLSLHHWVRPETSFQEIYRVLKKGGVALIFDFRRDSRKFFYGILTFATKIVVPKPLKEVNEPLGSIQSSYTPLEARELLNKAKIINIKITPYLAWMFIKIIK
ncbi:MAG: class I SAM-dependent methyltransferase [Promethearchaeota archaeon]